MSEPAPETSSKDSLEANSPHMARAFRATAMLGGALLATGVCYFALGAVGIAYPTPPEVLNLGAMPTPEERATADAAKLVADSGNAMTSLGYTGAIIGAVLALISGLLRRSGLRVVLSAIAGLVLGGGMGCLAGKMAVQTHAKITREMVTGTSGAETKFMMMHGLTWLLVGLAVGLACELGNRTMTLKSIVVALLVGGTMGGVAGIGFPLTVAIAAPLLDSSFPVPALGTGMVVFVGLGATLISIGVDRATTSTSR